MENRETNCLKDSEERLKDNGGEGGAPLLA